MWYYWTDGTDAYSVDMIHAYVNLAAPPVTQRPVDDIKDLLDGKVWARDLDGTGMVSYTPNAVLAAPEQYADDVSRIDKANLDCPLLFSDTHMVDGFHRLAAAVRKGVTSLPAIDIDADTFKLFRIRANDAIETEGAPSTAEMIQTFFARFKDRIPVVNTRKDACSPPPASASPASAASGKSPKSNKAKSQAAAKSQPGSVAKQPASHPAKDAASVAVSGATSAASTTSAAARTSASAHRSQPR
jgi:hypothetical protein